MSTVQGTCWADSSVWGLMNRHSNIIISLWRGITKWTSTGGNGGWIIWVRRTLLRLVGAFKGRSAAAGRVCLL